MKHHATRNSVGPQLSFTRTETNCKFTAHRAPIPTHPQYRRTYRRWPTQTANKSVSTAIFATWSWQGAESQQLDSTRNSTEQFKPNLGNGSTITEAIPEAIPLQTAPTSMIKARLSRKAFFQSVLGPPQRRTAS